MNRILLVDDHPIIVRGLEAVLKDALPAVVVEIAETPDQALAKLRESHWHVVVVDLNLPSRGGFELIRLMKELRPKVPVLIYSMYSEEQFGLRAIQAGADGFLPKDSPVEEIPRAVSALLNGKRYVRDGLASVLIQAARSDGQPKNAKLSDREEQVIRMLAAGKSSADIAENLALSAKSVATYKARIQEKLGVRTTAELIRYAVDNGYV